MQYVVLQYEYNNFDKKLSALSYFLIMQQKLKEQEECRYEMDQRVTTNSIVGLINHDLPSFSMQYLDRLQYEKDQIKIENDISEPFRRGKGDSQSPSHSNDDPILKKSSVYHNFQKHLITTLKLHINFNSYRKSQIKSDRLAVLLWEHFIKSMRPTKRYLYSLLMNIPQNIIEFKNKYRDKTHQENFEKMITEASSDQIRLAQDKLRQHLMRQSKKLVADGELDRRRMHKIEEFKDYFNKFIEQLESGELYLRLPKRNKNLQSSIKYGQKGQKKEVKQQVD